ncbi:hypothetical protein [Yinghuangia seranimata]|uniref:hypothetical protein n=1 Tax=Yinghuangia seranimata TaxID=408067 RepID=UPI00248BF43C|nr:hypothetical protein [Yinghuangia seranimata]MDI2126535.1 hypothetical protein [Yinghuangia seranimata]
MSEERVGGRDLSHGGSGEPHGDPRAEPAPDAPLSALLADFWGGGALPEPPAEQRPDPASERLAAPPEAIRSARGRNMVDLLRVAYDAMTSR